MCLNEGRNLINGIQRIYILSPVKKLTKKNQTFYYGGDNGF